MQAIIHNIRALLEAKDKFYIIFLSCITFISLLLEIIGLAIIVPIISLTVSSEETSNILFGINFDQVAVRVGFTSTIELLLIALVIIFIIKSAFFVLLYYNQKSFVSNLINKISDKLFYRYSNQQIHYYTKQNRASIVQNLQNESYFLFLFFESLTVLLSEALLVVCMLIFMLFFDSSGLLFIVSYFGIVTLLYTSVTKKKAIEWGEERLSLDQKISKTILETFGFIKEIIINNSQSYFNERYARLNKKKFHVFIYMLTLDQIPRVYFELVTVIFIVAYTYYLDSLNIPTNEIMTQIGILVAISYKVMPSLSKVSASYQTIRQNAASLGKIYHEITEAEVREESRLRIEAFEQEILFKEVSYAYPQTSNLVLNHLCLSIGKHEIVGIIGKSGQGKTTLLDIISGVITDFEGEVIIDGKVLDKKACYWKPKVSYVSQSAYIFDDSIKNNVCISKPGNSIDKGLLDTAIQMASLREWVDSLDLGIETSISQDGISISGGQKQRIGIARAIYNNTDLLIFDEPTSSLDEVTEQEIMNTIYELKGKKTVIIVTHKIDTLNQCDRIIEL